MNCERREADAHLSKNKLQISLLKYSDRTRNDFTTTLFGTLHMGFELWGSRHSGDSWLLLLPAHPGDGSNANDKFHASFGIRQSVGLNTHRILLMLHKEPR